MTALPPRSARRAVAAALLAGPALWFGQHLAYAAPVTTDPLENVQPASSRQQDSGRTATTRAVTPADRIMLADSTQPIARGVDLRSFEWVDAEGYLRGDLMKIDLAAGGVTPDYLFPGTVAKAEPLSQMAGRSGAIAAVNGDYFDINNSNAPLGAVKQNGVDIKGGNPDFTRDAVGVSTSNLGRLTSLFLEGTITLPSGPVALGGLNQNVLPADGVGAFTELWGAYTRTRVTGGATKVTEVITRDGVVTSVAPAAGEGQLAPGEVAYVGRNAGADKLAGLKVGDRVTMHYHLKNDGDALRMALSTNMVVLRDGNVVPQRDKNMHPRTAVGFDATGRTMFLLVVDGRMAQSRGMTYEEIGTFLKEVGAVNGANLDGGGSSTMLAREAGEKDLSLENVPSDGGERFVPNGVGLFARAGSGAVTGMRFVTQDDKEDDALWKVFPGLTRELDALGHDETYAPVAAQPAYAMAPADGTVDGDGTARPSHPGQVPVTAKVGQVTATHDLTVLGELRRLRSTVEKVTIADPAQAQAFALVGADANGFEARIEPADVQLDYDRSLVEVTPTDRGEFSVKARDGAKGGLLVKATVKGVQATVPVAIGTVQTTLADFADAADWRFTNARAAGSVAPAPGHDGGPALKMDFDFTLSTATRVGYARPPQPLVLQGQPLAIGAWVHGDGQGEWTSFGIQDGTGKAMSLYGPYITWTGWRYIEVQVPQTLQTPIQLNFVAAIETKAASSYKGTVSFDDVTVKTSPTVEVPAVAPVQDPVVNQHTAIDTSGRTWTFAVISDAQFTAANQSLVPAARRTMREAVAAKPDFVVITGDLVDTGYPADMALARQIIDEELTGKVPWHYVPGNHEIYGTNSTANFEAAFGPTKRVFDHKGTRFVLLDSSTGTLLGGGFEQWQMLRRALDGAASDPAINGVVTMFHHPPRDPSPLKNSQLTNRVEAGTVEQWLADFRLRTGKGAAFVGSHVGAFSANSVDAVGYVVNGNMGKTPATSIVAQGGFTGWTLVGIDPTVKPTPGAQLHRLDPGKPGYRRWMQVEMRAHVDDLALTAPATLGVGASASATGHVTQHGRTFELEYPVSAAWGGAGVFVGRPAAAPADAVVAYDPAARALTGLRAGTAELTLTVNGVTRTQTITVG